jgi:nucleotide-binding universal stress UspA family protein
MDMISVGSLPAGCQTGRTDNVRHRRLDQGGLLSSYGTILVGTDGSQSSFRAVERAAKLAADTGGTLLIASAFMPMSDRDQRRAAEALGEESYKVVGSHPAEDILREARDLAAKAGAKTIDTVCKPGDPVDVLVQIVDEHKADLCVVGNRGLNSLAGRIIGSVPANISHRASCDVLIVHTTSGRGR